MSIIVKATTKKAHVYNSYKAITKKTHVYNS